MKEASLKLINPFTLARQGAELKGKIALANMEDLSSLLGSALSGEANYHLEFSQHGDKRAYVNGNISADVPLVCQRCGEVFQDHVVTETHLQVVLNDAQASQLAASYEPLMVNEDHCVPLIDLVQEEIILALPMFAKHPEGQCVNSI